MQPERLEGLPLETQRVPLCPGIRLRLLSPAVDLEGPARERLAESAPFWAFCWASGQVLARHLLDHAELVRDRRVVDFGCGSGVVAVAAALAGAAHVVACDCDPLAREVARANGILNGVSLTGAESLESALDGCEVLLASDVIYEAPGLQRLIEAAEWVERVLIADPERRPLAHEHLVRLGWRPARTLPDVDEETSGAALFRVRPQAREG